MNKSLVVPIFLSLIVVSGCEDVLPSASVPPQNLTKYCVSSSGLSKYYIDLDIPKRTGTIRYQYMAQDVLYVIRSIKTDNNEISGAADFSQSSTGETRGNPLEFSFDYEQNILTDGSSEANCTELQDRSLLQFGPVK